jgi:cyclopropane fatty-acyl-phospholipid synthase-like methyltransferase
VTKKIVDTYEEQYDICLDRREKFGQQKLGLMANQTWIDDPKRLTFTLSRYKFVSKMMAGFPRVLEIGSADAFASRIVAQSVKHLVATDIDPVFIQDCKDRIIVGDHINVEYQHLDILGDVPQEGYNGVYALDVFEHIDVSNEHAFLGNCSNLLVKDGVLILGIPSIESQPYASEPSKRGHVNCKSGEDFKNLLSNYFSNTFLFSMNDEVVHTGFSKMANYLLVVCCGKKDK